jgi:hypothetical protein
MKRWLLCTLLWGCGPAVHAPSVPAWRTEAEGLRAQWFLDHTLDAPGQARLAFLLDFESNAPEQANAVPAQTVRQRRAAAFRALERRAPGWEAQIRAVIAEAPAAPETAGLIIAAQHAGMVATLPERHRLVVHGAQDYRAAWWLASVYEPDRAARLAASWATAWPRHAPAWFAVGVTTPDPADAVFALERAAQLGHVDAALALAQRLEAGGWEQASRRWRQRVDRLSPGAVAGSTHGPAASPTTLAWQGPWQVNGTVGAGTFTVEITGPGLALRAGLSGSEADLAQRLSRVLPGAWPQQIQCAAEPPMLRCRVDGRLDPGPGRWLAALLPHALGGTPSNPVNERWVLTTPSSWRWRRAWASFEKTAGWGRFAQHVQPGPAGPSIRREWRLSGGGLDQLDRADAARALHQAGREAVADATEGE